MENAIRNLMSRSVAWRALLHICMSLVAYFNFLQIVVMKQDDSIVPEAYTWKFAQANNNNLLILCTWAARQIHSRERGCMLCAYMRATRSINENSWCKWYNRQTADRMNISNLPLNNECQSRPYISQFIHIWFTHESVTVWQYGWREMYSECGTTTRMGPLSTNHAVLAIL